jgi:hypothetical protein
VTAVVPTTHGANELPWLITYSRLTPLVDCFSTRCRYLQSTFQSGRIQNSPVRSQNTHTQLANAYEVTPITNMTTGTEGGEWKLGELGGEKHFPRLVRSVSSSDSYHTNGSCSLCNMDRVPAQGSRLDFEAEVSLNGGSQMRVAWRTLASSVT